MTVDGAPVVQVRDAFVAYRGAGGSVMALRGADLSLGSAERLLVVGPNGSGKSTLLRVITGEQPVLAGTVEVGGTPLHELTAVQRRQWRARSVGFVDQYAGRGLLPERPVLDNVSLQLRMTGVTTRHRADEIARDTLGRLGLEGLLGRRVSELSGGEAQRVAVCAAIAHGPHLVLADEPTGELDEESAREVYELLGRIADDGAGVILVSHDPRAIAFADRAVRIRDGRTAEQWRPGSDVVEQVPDSRGWIRIPVERAPDLDPVPPLVAEPGGGGLLLRRSRPRPTDSARTRPAAPIAAPAATAQILASCVDLGMRFGDRQLFLGLGLGLRSSVWTVLTGPSGSGKSTLLSLLAGLADPTAGSVGVGGTGWAGLSRADRAEHRRRWISVLPQRPALLEMLTVRENLQLTAEVRGRPGAGERIDELAERLGLTRLLDQPGQLLSGGERQRAALARCLVTTAPVLLLDEPTSQQDESSVARVVEVLRDEVTGGRGILAASHDPRFLAEATESIALTLGRTPVIAGRRGPVPAAGPRDRRS